MDKKIDHEVDTGIMKGFMGTWCENPSVLNIVQGSFLRTIVQIVHGCMWKLKGGVS